MKSSQDWADEYMNESYPHKSLVRLIDRVRQEFADACIAQIQILYDGDDRYDLGDAIEVIQRALKL